MLPSSKSAASNDTNKTPATSIAGLASNNVEMGIARVSNRLRWARDETSNAFIVEASLAPVRIELFSPAIDERGRMPPSTIAVKQQPCHTMHQLMVDDAMRRAKPTLLSRSDPGSVGRSQVRPHRGLPANASGTPSVCERALELQLCVVQFVIAFVMSRSLQRRFNFKGRDTSSKLA